MALVLIGINHTTAGIALREKVAFPPDVVADALGQLGGIADVREVVLVSTCNRTEIYLAFQAGDDTAIDNRELVDRQQIVVSWLADYHKLDVEELAQSSYFFGNEDVVRHLMKVSCGLDSMVLGEPQIFGQIKSAYAVSKDLEVVGGSLGKAFQQAFTIAKEVRTDTAIGENPVSVAYAAVALAERIFSKLNSLQVLLIGAGRTIELVAKHLVEKGVQEIIVANRTLDNALDIASRINGHGVLLSDIPEKLIATDIVVSSTNSQLPLLGKGSVEKALKQRKHKPMLLVDLAVPRDIEEEVGEIADAYLYSIDDISNVIEDGVKSRAEAAAEAHLIIERGIEEYLKQLRSLNAVATLRAFRAKAEKIRDLELEKAIKALESDESPEEILNNLARGITNKLTHTPSVQMKKASAEGRNDLLKLTQELYDLQEENSKNDNPKNDNPKSDSS
jgi:glutamyl-tRNA reductase|tara:strand:- start:4836 stop:6179 length:1344 start_codon:yes stop_codon:yes gene_type:complete